MVSMYSKPEPLYFHMQTSTYINYFLLFSFAIGIPYLSLVCNMKFGWRRMAQANRRCRRCCRRSRYGNGRYMSWNKQTQLESCLALVLVELFEQSVVLLFIYPSSSTLWPRQSPTKQPVFNSIEAVGSHCVFGECARFSFWTSIDSKWKFNKNLVNLFDQTNRQQRILDNFHVRAIGKSERVDTKSTARRKDQKCTHSYLNKATRANNASKSNI